MQTNTHTKTTPSTDKLKSSPLLYWRRPEAKVRQVCTPWERALLNALSSDGKSIKDLEHLLKTPQAKYAITVAKNVKSLSREFIGYANHYHATWMKKKPYWAKGKKPVKVIGQHAFYKL